MIETFELNPHQLAMMFAKINHELKRYHGTLLLDSNPHDPNKILFHFKHRQLPNGRLSIYFHFKPSLEYDRLTGNQINLCDRFIDEIHKLIRKNEYKYQISFNTTSRDHPQDVHRNEYTDALVRAKYAVVEERDKVDEIMIENLINKLPKYTPKKERKVSPIKQRYYKEIESSKSLIKKD